MTSHKKRNKRTRNESANGASAVIGVFTTYFEPAVNGGGPIRTLSALISNVPSKYSVRVVTSDTDLGMTAPLDVRPDVWTPYGDALVYYTSSASWWSYLRALRSLRVEKPWVIYLNSVFAPRFSIIPALLHRFGWFGKSALLIAPRGEFGDGALRIKSKKKHAYLSIASPLFSRTSVSWHASSASEARDIRRVMGDSSRVLIREDETSLPVEPFPGVLAVGGPLRLVFVGRIVPIKGLDILLQGIAGLRPDIHLDVIGPAEDVSYARRCRELADTLRANVSVAFRGPMSHSDILDELETYHLMVMPSRGENFGHVIAEGLSRSLPVFCSAQTPWSEILSAGGGRVLTSNTSSEWGRQIDEVAGYDQDQLRAMKMQAGDAYRAWRNAETTESVFSLLDNHSRDGGIEERE